jgi:hypothetical protein
MSRKPIQVYHISPDANINVFRGMHSAKHGDSGVFVTPSKLSIYRSWAAYVKGRKSKNHPKMDGEYKELTLYTLTIPEWALAEAMARHNEKLERAIEEAGEDKSEVFAAWGWDVEVFIPKDLLPQLRITGRKTLPASKFVDNYRGRAESRGYGPGDQGKRNIVDIADSVPDPRAKQLEKQMHVFVLERAKRMGMTQADSRNAMHHVRVRIRENFMVEARNKHNINRWYLRNTPLKSPSALREELERLATSMLTPKNVKNASRNELIRLASDLPHGSHDRREILRTILDTPMGNS